jgi:hypothetical protein
MEKQQPVRRLGRLRSLAVSGAVLGVLVAGAGALTATAAHAATAAPAHRWLRDHR